MTQQYSLRWNNHQPNFISTFASLLSTRTLVDVTLAAEGQHMPAHKLVLCACSTYFQSLFTETPSQHPIVILKDVAFADLKILVDFMYFGQVNVTEEQLPQVLNTAKTLKIKGLTEMPESTSMTRSQSTSADFGDMPATPRAASSPPASPSSKRKRRRKSPTSTQIHLLGEEGRPPPDDAAAARNSIILSNVPQQQRRVDFLDEQAQQVDTHDLTVEPMSMDANAANAENMQQGGQWNMVEHTYPRYSSGCVGNSAMQQEQGVYNVMGTHVGVGVGVDGGLGEYAQALGVAGLSPGAAPEPPPLLDHSAPMPPNKRRRTTNPQSEENFQRALEAVRFGGIGFCKAARMFGVNNRTLWLEYKKKGYPNNRPSIRSRIKREHTTPPRELKEPPPERQLTLVCPAHAAVPVGFVDSRPLDFPLQGVPHSSPINILGVNFIQ